MLLFSLIMNVLLGYLNLLDIKSNFAEFFDEVFNNQLKLFFLHSFFLLWKIFLRGWNNLAAFIFLIGDFLRGFHCLLNRLIDMEDSHSLLKNCRLVFGWW